MIHAASLDVGEDTTEERTTKDKATSIDKVSNGSYKRTSTN